MGGVWEGMIGVARRILDALLLKTKTFQLTHEVLVTLMSEVMAIMNARPLVLDTCYAPNTEDRSSVTTTRRA